MMLQMHLTHFKPVILCTEKNYSHFITIKESIMEY
jgi:hypothetical protein